MRHHMLFQVDEQNNKLFINSDVACAYYGAREENYHTHFSSYEDLDEVIQGDAFANLIPVGSIEYIQKYAELRSIPLPKLPINSLRPGREMTLEEALSLPKPIFIKPTLDHLKLFTGFVHEGYIYTAIKDLSPDTPVLVYKAFDSRIVSEWRCYVVNGVLDDCRNYMGDYLTPPRREYIESLISTVGYINDFPDTYAVDVANLQDGSWIDIEFNDFWGLGNYGMPNWLYAKAICRRWNQILEN